MFGHWLGDVSNCTISSYTYTLRNIMGHLWFRIVFSSDQMASFKMPAKVNEISRHIDNCNDDWVGHLTTSAYLAPWTKCTCDCLSIFYELSILHNNPIRMTSTWRYFLISKYSVIFNWRKHTKHLRGSLFSDGFVFQLWMLMFLRNKLQWNIGENT